MSFAVLHDPRHPNHITNPCRWVYASGRECGLSPADHERMSRGPQHPWSAERRTYPQCVQCGASVRGWGHMWPTGAVSCADCYYADWGCG